MDEHAASCELLSHLSFDAPFAFPESVFAAAHRSSDEEASEDEAVFWDDGSSITVGLGSAARASGRGPDRWRDARRRVDRIFQRLEVTEPAAPKVFGRATFAEHRADFVLPRWTYRVDSDGKATISVVVPRTEASSIHGRRTARREALARLERLAGSLPAAGGRPVFVRRPDAASWRADVEAALHAIATGRLTKVVAARPFYLAFDGEPSVEGVLQALAAARDRRNGAVRFAFRQAGVTFLGLTPERLVAVQGRHVQSEALAGTAPAGGRDAALLLASPKDGHEHRLVVEEIAARLRPLCTRLLHDASPRLRPASGVQHLLTPIEGELRRRVHLLDLARRLHPTPAVCGLPSAEARHWIARHETTTCGDRGDYTGAVGHFDAFGHGELRVALRCARVEGKSARVWAGAGLVAGSDPDRELEEITSKAETMLRALDAPSPSADRMVHLPFTRLA